MHTVVFKSKKSGFAMADIQDLQFLFLHFDVTKMPCSNAGHLQSLIWTFPEHTPSLFEARCCLLLMIEQLEEQ
jgi:hypothetical protein